MKISDESDKTRKEQRKATDLFRYTEINQTITQFETIERLEIPSELMLSDRVIETNEQWKGIRRRAHHT